MMTTISKLASTLIAASLVSLTAPAFAGEKDGGSTAAQAATSMSASADAPKVKETKYCVKGTVTGSIMPQKRECRTKADWTAQGVDIEKYVK